MCHIVHSQDKNTTLGRSTPTTWVLRMTMVLSCTTAGQLQSQTQHTTRYTGYNPYCYYNVVLRTEVLQYPLSPVLYACIVVLYCTVCVCMCVYVWVFNVPCGCCRFAFSRNKQPTIVPIPNNNAVIGRATQMSPIDIRRINVLYNCSKRYSQQLTTAIDYIKQYLYTTPSNYSCKPL